MKGQRKMVCGATQTLGLLAFIYLLYTQSFAFDNAVNPFKYCFGNQKTSKWNATFQKVDFLGHKIHPALKSLMGRLTLFILIFKCSSVTDYTIDTAKTKADGDDGAQRLETRGFTCESAFNCTLCVASNPIKIDTKTMQIYLHSQFNLNNHTGLLDNEEEKVVQIRPYAWKQLDFLNVTTLKFVHESSSQNSRKDCDYNHEVPAILFSTGGFIMTGNIFHEFNDIIIPLFITSFLFKSQVQFVLVDYNPSFVKKFSNVFSSLSHYKLLDLMANTSVHCFPSVVVGLKFHKHLSINSSEVPKGNSMIDFKKFLGKIYGLKIMIDDLGMYRNKEPLLLLISRRKTRSFLNEDEIVDMMEELGFDVVVVRSNKKMSNLDKFSKLVSSCSVLVAAHGAGLTNQLFMSNGSVLVQVVPLGLEWASTVYYGEPAVDLGLYYLEYKIRLNESSLSDLYGPNDPVILDPGSIFAKGYFVAKEMYLDKQNIRVDVNRFKATLMEARRIIGHTTPLNTR
ncbi:xylan glycosyltransferase MUCI21-like [Rutidosis leptorrhynchoides]|uniref:xylan glycosyltransferase MUCI21-like n=1 Tax=Rutidosis leptorrhynchoides TaxID=125765 RepID=UPI003A991A0A